MKKNVVATIALLLLIAIIGICLFPLLQLPIVVWSIVIFVGALTIATMKRYYTLGVQVDKSDQPQEISDIAHGYIDPSMPEIRTEPTTSNEMLKEEKQQVIPPTSDGVIAEKSFKPAMLVHLQKQGITEISELWGYAKTYAKQNCYEMGGSYASFGDEISVILVKDDIREEFKISLEEVKKNERIGKK